MLGKPIKRLSGYFSLFFPKICRSELLLIDAEFWFTTILLVGNVYLDSVNASVINSLI